MRDAMCCSRGHKMTSSEPLDCACGGHDLYTCRMRLGAKPCGESRLVPPLSRECEEEDD